METRRYPVESALPELRAALAENRPVILEAPPGAGKTTVVPPALLGEPWLAGRKILILEPRRLAAKSAAKRMADLRGEPVGGTVGYRVRLESRVSAATRLEVVTEGILTRMLQDDPALPEVGLLVFDEYHERNLHTDLGLALALDAREQIRPDLRLLVMSATLDPAALARALPGPATVRAAGRMFDVETRWLGDGGGRRLEERAAEAALEALAGSPGDVLVFLPGTAEIRRTLGALRPRLSDPSVEPVALYGDLPLAEQERAIRPAPPGRRKVVLATAIAETSLTIEGVTAVVDAGLMRTLRNDPATGLDRLVTETVTRDAAEQRRGRAGRLAPGLCLRLWSAATDRGLVERREPELRRADLARFALELAAWGARDPLALRFPDPPPAGGWERSVALLRALDALGPDGRITPHGRALLALPLHPRLAHMCLKARDLGFARLGARIAALLEERDLLVGVADPDLRRRLVALDAAAAGGDSCGGHGRGTPTDPASAYRGDEPDRGRRARVAENARAIERTLGGAPGPTDPARAGTLLAFAYPDRIGRRRAELGAYRLSGGRGARAPAAVPVADEWIVAAALDEGTVEARLFLYAALDPAEFAGPLAALVGRRDEIRWDEAAGRVITRRLATVGELILKEEPLREPDPEAVTAALLDGIRKAGLARLPWTREAEGVRERIAFLARAAADLAEWPATDDAALAGALEAWLGPAIGRPAVGGPAVGGMTRIEHLKSVDLAAALLTLLPPDARRQFDRLAPTHLTVPSGSRIRIDYAGAEPVLAAKLQELFGWADAPRLAGGRVPVVVHLLSPAMRPLQVTRDLAGFWRATYPEVRREMRIRYPKHDWPEDPTTAPPSRGPKRRRP